MEASNYIYKAGGERRRWKARIGRCCVVLPSGGDGKMPRRCVENVELCGSLVTRRLQHVNYQGVGAST